MINNSIVLTVPPAGHFEWGKLGEALYPGQIAEITPATTFVGGHPVWRASTRTAGAYRGIAVVLNDLLQGFLPTTQIAAAQLAGLYWPLPGEELRLLLGDVAGTADDVAQGDLFGVSTAGKLIANSSYTFPCFQAMEGITDPSADQLLWVKYLG